MARRVVIKGVRRKELDTAQIAYVLFVAAKRQVEERRRREAAERERQATKRKVRRER